MMFLRTCRLQTLLLLMFCACVEDVPPTVLRFYVYSDVPLARVKASLLDEAERELLDGGISRDFYPEAGAPDGRVLLSIAVERTDRSNNREQAIVRFDGYTESSADSKMVLRQTVRADFEDKQTRLVRIWLSRACIHASARPCNDQMSCDEDTGACTETPIAGTERFDPSADLSSWQKDNYTACGARDDAGRNDTFCPPACGPQQDSDCSLLPPASPCTNDDQCWSGTCECVDGECRQLRCCTPPCSRQCGADLQNDPKNCGSCGLACPYPSCSSGQCTQTVVLPPQDADRTLGTVEFRAVYLRRVVGANHGIAAVGVRSSQVGAQLKLFVATDVQGQPGKVLASGDVTVKALPSTSDGMRTPATEYVFPMTVLGDSEAPYWIGVGTAGAKLEVVASDEAGGDFLAESVPEPGESLPALKRSGALPAAPSIYAVCYP